MVTKKKSKNLADSAEKVRKTLQKLGDANKKASAPKRKPVGPTKPVRRSTQTSALYHGVGRSSRTRQGTRKRKK